MVTGVTQASYVAVKSERALGYLYRVYLVIKLEIQSRKGYFFGLPLVRKNGGHTFTSCL